MNRDVITGPGEYRMRNGRTWHCCAVVNGTAVGYTLNDDGEVTHTGCRYADSGLVSKGSECTLDILPPEPVITGPGPYETRDGGTWHCSVIIKGVAYGHRQWPGCSETLISGSRNADTGECNREIDDESGDVIRKRRAP